MSDEWYTPKKYIEAAREVMGSIDLDPCSCEIAQRTVQAKKYYSIEKIIQNEDQWHEYPLPWSGNIWLNPPYSQKNVWIARWINESVHQSDHSAILLVPSSTDTQWFQPLWDYQLCFTDHRIQFETPHGKSAGNRSGSVFAYWGPHGERFAKVFSQFGHVTWPVWED